MSSLSYIFTSCFIYFKKYTIKLNSRNTIFGYSSNKEYLRLSSFEVFEPTYEYIHCGSGALSTEPLPRAAYCLHVVLSIYVVLIAHYRLRFCFHYTRQGPQASRCLLAMKFPNTICIELFLVSIKWYFLGFCLIELDTPEYILGFMPDKLVSNGCLCEEKYFKGILNSRY